MRSSSRARAFVVLVSVTAVAPLACSRTPPEPLPASTANTTVVPTDRGPVKPATTAAPEAGSRCIKATPAEAPAIPPAATSATCPRDPDGIPKLQIASVTFPGTTIPKLEVEIASTERDIERGLMYRMSMPEEHGMLFNLPERRDHMFWMHNTCIPLDMLFVDDDGTIVGIFEGAAPLTDTTRSVGCPSSWVLEVNGGWCRRHGLRAGQKMVIPPIAR